MTTPDNHQPEGLPVELVGTTTPPLLKLVAIMLGVALLLALALIGGLAWAERGIPDVLQNVAVGSLAALSALLVGNRG